MVMFICDSPGGSRPVLPAIGGMDQLRLEPPGRFVLVELEPGLPLLPPVLLPADEGADAACDVADCVVVDCPMPDWAVDCAPDCVDWLLPPRPLPPYRLSRWVVDC